MSASIDISNLDIEFQRFVALGPSIREYVSKRLLGKPTKASYLSALSAVNLHIDSDERVGIVGQNGAGKSTLLKCIAGIYPPSAGTIDVHGSLVPLLELGAGFSMSMTVRKNIYLNGAIRGFRKRDIRELEDEILDFSELREFADYPLINLSSGMRSRLGFSIASYLQPEILLLDEVFATGDASFVIKAKERMMRMIDSCKIVVIVSHQERIIRDICTRLVVLHHGQVVADDTISRGYQAYYGIIRKQN